VTRPAAPRRRGALPTASGPGLRGLVPAARSARLSIAEEIFARPELPKVFVSSRMRGGALRLERRAVANEIDATRMAQAWWWERSAYAGPFSAQNICLKHAATSDALFVILEDDLTPITKAEYLAAKRNGVYRCILIRDGATLTARAQRFVDREQRNVTTAVFRNISELRSQTLASLRGGFTHSLRQRNARERMRLRRRGT
jgi:hypothetical protein